MAISTRTMRIVGATLIAVVLIGGAFVLSSSSLLSPVNAASTEELLRAYAAKDTDSDGLPDWEESLYGTDPENAHSADATLTDRQAVDKGIVKPKFSSETPVGPEDTTLSSVKATPGTLTDRFARQLFSNYLQSRGATPPTAEEIAAYTQQAVDDLLGDASLPNEYTEKNLKIQGEGPAALRTYAAAAERAYAAHTVVTTQDELSYFSDYLKKDDATALKTFKSIGTAYANTGKTLAGVSVPKEASYAHLELVNAMSNMGKVIADMSAVKEDPVRALVGIAAYSNTHRSLIKAFDDLMKIYKAEQVVILEGTEGFYFYNALTVGSQAAAALK